MLQRSGFGPFNEAVWIVDASGAGLAGRTFIAVIVIGNDDFGDDRVGATTSTRRPDPTSAGPKGPAPRPVCSIHLHGLYEPCSSTLAVSVRSERRWQVTPLSETA